MGNDIEYMYMCINSYHGLSLTCKGISFVGKIAIGVSTGVFITVISGLVLLILCACVIRKHKAGEWNLLLLHANLLYITEQAPMCIVTASLNSILHD